MTEKSPGESTPRLLPDVRFPPYSYVPDGGFPHPVRDPAGHSHAVAHEPSPCPDPDEWQMCRPFLYGVDLFNHGYYWEAHEVWEGLWHGCGRHGPTADFLKGLIKLAAAGVKVRQGMPAGVRTHARRAAALFRATAAINPARARFLGLEVAALAHFADDVALHPPDRTPQTAIPAEVVFDFVLRPE
jgi:hypothetical protein